MTLQQSALAVFIGLALCGAAYARPAPVDTATDATTLDAITVTARLREESADRVPVAMTVLERDTLRRQRVDDTHSLFKRVPGLSLTSFDDGRFAYFQLRGIGPLSQAISPDDGSVVTYVDGVPQPVYASEIAYFDLERIEVLRGPQGTLFGRNSQGGALNISTRQPGATRETTVRVEAGESGYGLAEVGLSGPLVEDRVAGAFAARTSSIDGFVRNTAPDGGKLGGRENHALRGSLVLTPAGSDGARISLSANADRVHSDPFYYVLRGQDAPRVEVVPENHTERDAWGLSATVVAPLSFAEFTSVTAVNGFSNHQVTDDSDGLIYGPLNGLPASAFLPPLDWSDWREHERRLYQEFRLSSGFGSTGVWTAGATYFASDFDIYLANRSSFSPFLNGDRDAEQKIRSQAAFAELTGTLGDPRLRGTLGARFTRDEKRLASVFTGVGFPGTVDRFAQDSAVDFSLWTGRAGLDFAWSETTMLYASAGRGAKSGGYPRLALSAALGAPSRHYAASTSWTYELGAKTRSADGRAHFDASLFLNDVSDEQLFVLDFVSFQSVPVNLDTRSRGVELQGGVRLGRGWQLDGGLAWTDGEIREGGASGARPGNRIPNVARVSSALSLGYEGAPVALAGRSLVPTFDIGHQYMGSRAADVGESFELPGWHNVDVRLGARAGALEVYLFARNLFDSEQQLNGALYAPGIEGASLGRGRVAGIGLSARF